MEKNLHLIQLSESDQTELGRVDFAAQSPAQRVFSAIWQLESYVNNDGFNGYFSSWGGETANFAPQALEQIGALACADIVRRALAVVSTSPLPDDYYQRETLIYELSDAQVEALEQLDQEFCGYPDNLTESLYAFVASRPLVFGQVPEECDTAPAVPSGRITRSRALTLLLIAVAGFIILMALILVVSFIYVLVSAA